VFHYQVEIGADPVTTELSLFHDNAVDWLTTAIKDVQSNAHAFLSAKSQIIVGGDDEYETEFSPINGSASGEGMPPHDCFTFKYVRGTTNTRHGWKRIGGVPEVAQAGGVVTSTFLPGLEAVAVALASSVMGLEADDNTFHPVIVSKVLNGVPRDPWYINAIQDVVYKHIGTQNTRKIGRGS
jgi:hypothetical protein